MKMPRRLFHQPLLACQASSPAPPLSHPTVDSYLSDAFRLSSSLYSAESNAPEDNNTTKRSEEEPLVTEDLSPVMDSMYQVAIEEMVEKAFSAADVNKDGMISYEEFRWALCCPLGIHYFLCSLNVSSFIFMFSLHK